jgi:hypothetical protein
MFVDARPGDQAELRRAFESQLPEAERYLDGIVDQARTEAGLFAKDATGLVALLEKVRTLSRS